MKKISQKGRSMVEMLGVLAIVGVLSVGAIAGYSKAMFKYKMNKTMDIISHAVARVAELDTMKLKGEIWTAPQMRAYGIMPDCDVNYTDIDGYVGEACSLPLGEMEIDFAQWDNYPMHGEFIISFLQEPFESCLAFFNSGIYKDVPEDWWVDTYNGDTGFPGGFIQVENGQSHKKFYGKADWVIEEGGKSELSNTDILDACEHCKNGKYCQIYWVVRAEM